MGYPYPNGHANILNMVDEISVSPLFSRSYLALTLLLDYIEFIWRNRSRSIALEQAFTSQKHKQRCVLNLPMNVIYYRPKYWP